jgi:hypothetical protein
MATKPGLSSLLLLGAAAFGAYKYSKMTEEQKRDLMEKGKKFVNDNFGDLSNVLGTKNTGTPTGNGTIV